VDAVERNPLYRSRHRTADEAIQPVVVRPQWFEAPFSHVAAVAALREKVEQVSRRAGEQETRPRSAPQTSVTFVTTMAKAVGLAALAPVCGHRLAVCGYPDAFRRRQGVAIAQSLSQAT